MRPVIVGLLTLCLAGSAWSQTKTVELFQVRIVDDTVTVEYSKSFKACAHLYNDQGQITHATNLFCETGDQIVTVNDLSDFTNLEVGDVVHLQHGNNSKIRSEDVTVTGPEAVELHSVAIDGDIVTVEYSKNFAACVQLYNDNGDLTHTENLFCEMGDHVVSVNDLSDFTDLQAGDVVHLEHSGNPAIRSEDVTVTVEDDDCPLEFALKQVRRQAQRYPSRGLLSQFVPERMLQSARRFRDESLAQSPAGRRLIAMYYRHRDESRRILSAHPELAARSLALVVRARPALDASCGQLTIDESLYSEGIALLEAMVTLASPELQSALAGIRRDLDSRSRVDQGVVTLSFDAVMPETLVARQQSQESDDPAESESEAALAPSGTWWWNVASWHCLLNRGNQVQCASMGLLFISVCMVWRRAVVDDRKKCPRGATRGLR